MATNETSTKLKPSARTTLKKAGLTATETVAGHYTIEATLEGLSALLLTCAHCGIWSGGLTRATLAKVAAFLEVSTETGRRVHIKRVPLPVYEDDEMYYVLMGYVEGSPIAAMHWFEPVASPMAGAGTSDFNGRRSFGVLNSAPQLLRLCIRFTEAEARRLDAGETLVFNEPLRKIA